MGMSFSPTLPRRGMDTVPSVYAPGPVYSISRTLPAGIVVVLPNHRLAPSQGGHPNRCLALQGQASGGARDWNGARRGAIKTTAAELKCSTDRATNGTGSCGAGGRNEIAVRWMVAQIAQESPASPPGCCLGAEGLDCVLAEARLGTACPKLPRWTWPNDRAICTVSAKSANRAPAFNFALNHCITNNSS